MNRKFALFISSFVLLASFFFFHITSASAATYCVSASGTAAKLSATVANAAGCTNAATTAAMSIQHLTVVRLQQVTRSISRHLVEVLQQGWHLHPQEHPDLLRPIKELQMEQVERIQ